MAGPFEIGFSSPGLWSAHVPPAGPFEFDGALFVLAFDEDEFLGVRKSTDGGVTWAQVGSEIEAHPFTGFGSCVHINFGVTPVIHVAYVDPASDIRVRPFDLNAEDWGSASSAGPAIELGIEGVASLLIEQSTDGDFGLLHIIEDQDASDVRRTSISLLDAALSSWTGPTDVDTNGTVDGDVDAPIGIARGAGGRIHGFIREFLTTGSSHATYHTLVRESGGGIGGALNLIESGGDSAGFGSGSFSGSQIGVLYFVGGGLPRSAIAESADVPTWTLADLDLAASGHVVLFAGSSGFEAFYAAGADVLRSAWSGTAWGTPDSAGVTGFAFAFSARLAGESSLIYSTDASDLWFVSIAPGGGGLILTGEIIPSGEFFFPTHGITGGGDPVNCGPVTVEPPESGCNPNPPIGPVDPLERDTCNLGTGYSY